MLRQQDARDQEHEARLALDKITSPNRVGLRLPEQMSFATWKRIGRQISVIADASVWWLGDWLVYGEDAYSDRYKRAIAETSLDYQTLRNYAWVARKFEQSRRRSKLSLHHHAEVAAMPAKDQDLWLDRAEQFCWTKGELRRQIKSQRAVSNGSDGQHTTIVRINVPTTREEQWQAAAATADRSLADWITSVLDEAAQTALALANEIVEDSGRLVSPASPS